MKIVKGLGILLCLFLLAGCVQIVPAGQATPTEDVKALLLPTETPVPVVIVVTATPEPATAVPTSTETPVATATLTPTPTQVAGITLNTLSDLGGGNINVSWSASGSFPKGFQVVWSATNSQPSFPGDSSTYLNDPNARSVQVRGEPGKTYYVRVCRYVESSCDLYSNVQQVTLAGTPITYNTYYPQYYYPQPQYYTYPTVNATTPPYLYISKVVYAGSWAADIYWKSYGNFDHGYILLFSTSPDTLIYGDTLQQVITNASTHSLTVTGGDGATFYYRICRFTGTTCDIYSNQVSFTFSE